MKDISAILSELVEYFLFSITQQPQSVSSGFRGLGAVPSTSILQFVAELHCLLRCK